MKLQEVKEQVKDRSDLAAVIGRHTKLVRTARGYKACCPLPGHKEKTPSFHIDTQKNYFYCYGCNRGGDIFTFLQVVEGLSFIEALRELAGQLNIELPRFEGGQIPSAGEKSERERGFELMDRAARYFNRILQDKSTPGAEPALHYLKKTRKLSDAEFADLGLGYAPASGDALARKLTSPADQEIGLKLGLIRDYSGRKVDFFRGRLMIPIHDPRGRVMGFSGRTLGEVGPKNPKYINSSESEWFKKKSVCYGLDRSAKLIREHGFVCIVEGFFDQWALHRYDIPAVAVMGTALTEEHMQLLGRYTRQVILVMDSDAAGIASTKKSLPPLLSAEWDVRVFSGFGGKDPDEWLQAEPGRGSELRNLLGAAPEGLEWLAKATLKEATDEKLNRLQVFNRLKEVWKLARLEAQRNILADELAPLLGLSREEIRNSLDDLIGRAPGKSPRQEVVPRAMPALAAASPRLGAPARPTIAQGSTYRRAAEETFTWWLWHWKILAPQNEVEWDRRREIFRGTAAEAVVEKLWELWRQNPGDLKDSSVLSQWVKEGSEDELSRWILKGFVAPEMGAGEDDARVRTSFEEYAQMLDRERIRSDISRLQSEMRRLKNDEVGTAQLLQRVHELRLSLEKRK